MEIRYGELLSFPVPHEGHVLPGTSAYLSSNLLGASGHIPVVINPAKSKRDYWVGGGNDRERRKLFDTAAIAARQLAAALELGRKRRPASLVSARYLDVRNDERCSAASGIIE